MLLRIAALFMVLLVSSCTMYKPSAQLIPQHIKKIAIRQIINDTTVSGLEDKLYMRITDEFVRDGRFTITNEENADGVVVAKITYYTLQPLTYGPNFDPQQYKLRMLLNLYFIDATQNVTLWEEPNLEGVAIFNASTLPGGKTEEEARDIVRDDLSQKIITRTMAGFGSVAGISEKKVPKFPSTTEQLQPAATTQQSAQ
ncbi:MAG: hypothetical protein A2297_09265 [Elusimicrobia bacterium RIFOXYB2_FULL_48_7]|nr:MAG: hypothetical protein A2297_09265 [Elusimicrobia bacterium RIFOXYB2_FULL_48_7]